MGEGRTYRRGDGGLCLYQRRKGKGKGKRGVARGSRGRTARGGFGSANLVNERWEGDD